MLRVEFRAIGVAVAFLLAMGLLFHTAPVLAQDYDEEQTGAAIEEIAVEAPTIGRKVTARGTSGYTTEVVQLKRRVYYADLDLTKDSDILELEKRIEMTAREACEALEEMFPRGQKDAGDVYRCTKQAIENTEEDFENIVAAAN